MKRRVVAEVERAIVDLRSTIEAIERDDIDDALKSLAKFETRMRDLVAALLQDIAA